MLVAGCSTTHILPTPLPPFPTVAPLSQRAAYWDAGLSLNYPANWLPPIYSSGEMLLAPSQAAATGKIPQEPVITVQVSTLAQLNADKNTPIDLLLRQVSGANSDSVEVSQGNTTFAKLDALFLTFQDTKQDLVEQTVLFRLPDGRVGWLIALAPTSIWADFAPSADQIRASAVLLQPSDYPLSHTAAAFHFAAGGLTFNLPATWGSQAFGNAVIYHDQADPVYQDSSGFSNGPQLVARTQNLPAGQSIAAALASTLGVSLQAIQPITVGGQKGVQAADSDPTTGQQIVFVAVPSQNPALITVFRWTTPNALSAAARPILDAALQSLSFGAIDSSATPLFGG